MNRLGIVMDTGKPIIHCIRILVWSLACLALCVARSGATDTNGYGEPSTFGAAGPASDFFSAPPDVSTQAQAWYESQRRGPRPPFAIHDSVAMEKIRNAVVEVNSARGMTMHLGFEAREVDANGVRAVWLTTPDTRNSSATLLHCHGGGYVLGKAGVTDYTMLLVGLRAGARVLSVDYRLAPEHPFPAAPDDTLRAYRWLLDKGIPARKIAITGDSAGGGLALALLLRIRDEGLPPPGAAAVISPWADLTGSGDSVTTLADYDPILNWARLASCVEAYAAHHNPRDPYLSPLFGDFRGLPPLLVQVGGREILLSDGIRVAQKASEAGVDVTLEVWDGMPHAWHYFLEFPEARGAIDRMGAFLSSHVSD